MIQRLSGRGDLDIRWPHKGKGSSDDWPATRLMSPHVVAANYLRSLPP